MQLKTAGPVAVVRLAGRMVLGEETTSATDWLKAVIHERPRVVLEINDLRCVDPSGIGALLSLYTAAAHLGGQLRLARPSTKLATMLKTTKLSTILPIHDSTEEALAAFATS